ncbi:MAG: alpha/beta hydrolase family protein [Planctomycetaceae bacterium]
MIESHDLDRRRFLGTLGAGALGGFLLDAGGGAHAVQNAGEPAADAAPIPWGAPPDQPIELVPQDADMGTLFPPVNRLLQQNEFRYSFLGDRFQSLDEFKKAGREKVFEALRYRPEKVEPEAEVVDRTDAGDHIREKIVFNTAPGFRIAAYVLIPKKADKPAPAIVDLHSHGGMFIFGKEKVIDFGPGKNHPVMDRYHRMNYESRPTATALVRRGYVVISIDALNFGERRLLADSDLKHGFDRSKYPFDLCFELNARCRAGEHMLVQSLIYAGLTWPGMVVRDDMRTVDYLVTRPEVDPERVGCVGISMGGYRSLYLSGVDERIKAACVTGFMSTVKSMVKKHINKHSWVHYLPTIHGYLDWPDIVSMMAPKPLMVQQCEQDGLFPLEGMRESLEKIGGVYEKAGVKERFHGRFYDQRHIFSVAMQDEAFDFFDATLKSP